MLLIFFGLTDVNILSLTVHPGKALGNFSFKKSLIQFKAGAPHKVLADRGFVQNLLQMPLWLLKRSTWCLLKVKVKANLANLMKILTTQFLLSAKFSQSLHLLFSKVIKGKLQIWFILYLPVFLFILKDLEDHVFKYDV